MWNYDGHIVPVSQWRFGASASPGNGWIMPNESWMPAENYPALCVVHQSAESTTGTPPTLVTPSGWTAISAGQTTMTNANSRGMRFNTVYKVITAADLGATVIGMSGTQTNRICANIWWFNRPLQTVTVITGLTGMTASAAVPSTVTSNDDGVRAHGHIWCGFMHGESPVLNGDSSLDTDGTPFGGTYGAALSFPDWGYGSETATRTLFNSYPYNDGSGLRGVTPTNSEMSDLGNWGFDSSMIAGKGGDSGSWNTCCLVGFHLD